MDIQSLKAFIQVASYESFTKAAEEMNYAQSSISSQIQKLEAELGFPLFEKVGRKKHLTSGGREFLLYAHEILSLIQKAESIGQEIKNIKGTLRIGVLESLFFARLLPLMPQMRQHFPNVEMRLRIDQSSVLLSLLKQNQLDIAYISSTANTDSALNCCYQHREKLVFVVSKKHPLSKKKSCSIQDLTEFPFVTTEPSGYCYNRLNEIFSEFNLSFQHSFSINSASACLELLGDNKSIVFLPEYILNTEKNKNLAVLKTDLSPQYYYSQLLYPKNKWLSPVMDFLIEKLRTTYPE